MSESLKITICWLIKLVHFDQCIEMDYISYTKGNTIVHVLDLRKINFDDFSNTIKLEKGKRDLLKFRN